LMILTVVSNVRASADRREVYLPPASYPLVEGEPYWVDMPVPSPVPEGPIAVSRSERLN